MKRCQICGKKPVTASGFCAEHHEIWLEKRREFRKMFIEYMKERENEINNR